MEVQSYLNLRLIEEDLSKGVNFLGFEESLFEKFKVSKECEGLKMIVREKMVEKNKKNVEIISALKELPNS